jgi:hypothetical protein
VVCAHKWILILISTFENMRTEIWSLLSVKGRHLQGQCQSVSNFPAYPHVSFICVMVKKLTDFTIVKIALISVLLSVARRMDSVAMNCRALVSGNIDGIM